MSGNYYEEEFKFLRKERSWITVKNSPLHITYICTILYTIICNAQLYIAIGLWQDCIVQLNFCILLYYTDQFHIQLDLVQIMELWNVNYVNVNTDSICAKLVRYKLTFWTVRMSVIKISHTLHNGVHIYLYMKFLHA